MLCERNGQNAANAKTRVVGKGRAIWRAAGINGLTIDKSIFCIRRRRALFRFRPSARRKVKTGSGNTITAVRVPIVTSTGTIYKNITLLFNVDSSGNLTLASGYPKFVVSAPSITSSFKAGPYVGPTTLCSNMIINIAGPGVAPGGATEWTLAAGSGAGSCTYPDSATWYVGSLATSPLAARLKAAGITSTAWSYGVGGTPYGGNWGQNSLLGFSQIGRTLTIMSFTSYGKDYSEPVAQITYTLSQ